MEARFEPVDLAAFTADLASVFRSAMERAGLAYGVDCRELPAPVYIDREMWEKVVLNLLSNALKFTFDGTVSCRCEPRDATRCCGSADTGSGIAAAEMPRLFERFHRIPDRAVPVQRGQRHRARAGARAGRAARRHHHRAEHRGSGDHLHRPAPVRPRAPAGAIIWPRPAPELISAAADPFLAEALRWLPGDQPAEPTLAADEVGGPPRQDLAAAGPGRAGRTRARILLADDNADMRGVPATAAAARLPGDRSGRRAGSAGRGPGAALRPGDQRRDDAGPGRAAAGRGATDRFARPRTCRSCCCRPGPGRRRRSRGWKPARTTTWSSRSPRPSCWPGSGPTWNWPGCAATTPGGARR